MNLWRAFSFALLVSITALCYTSTIKQTMAEAKDVDVEDKMSYEEFLTFCDAQSKAWKSRMDKSKIVNSSIITARNRHVLMSEMWYFESGLRGLLLECRYIFKLSEAKPEQSDKPDYTIKIKEWESDVKHFSKRVLVASLLLKQAFESYSFIVMAETLGADSKSVVQYVTSLMDSSQLSDDLFSTTARREKLVNGIRVSVTFVMFLPVLFSFYF